MGNWQVWYLDSNSEWQFFYDHYGRDFSWALEDAHKTLGIDVWAIVRDGIVMAVSKDAWNVPSLKTLVIDMNDFATETPEWVDAFLRMHGYDPDKLAADMVARIAPLLAARGALVSS